MNQKEIRDEIGRNDHRFIVAYPDHRHISRPTLQRLEAAAVAKFFLNALQMCIFEDGTIVSLATIQNQYDRYSQWHDDGAKILLDTDRQKLREELVKRREKNLQQIVDNSEKVERSQCIVNLLTLHMADYDHHPSIEKHSYWSTNLGQLKHYTKTSIDCEQGVITTSRGAIERAQKDNIALDAFEMAFKSDWVYEKESPRNEAVELIQSGSTSGIIIDSALHIFKKGKSRFGRTVGNTWHTYYCTGDCCEGGISNDAHVIVQKAKSFGATRVVLRIKSSQPVNTIDGLPVTDVEIFQKITTTPHTTTTNHNA